MLKYLICIIVIISSPICHSQYFRLGGGINFLMQSDYFNYQIGPSIICDYTFDKIPCSVALNIRGCLGEFDFGKHHLGKYYTMLSYGTCFNYYPVKWVIEPYIGVGAFFNSHSISEGIGNMNNFSGECTLGFKLSAKTANNFFLEITKSYSKPSHEYEVYDPITFKSTYKTANKEYNFNSLYIKVGVMFKL